MGAVRSGPFQIHADDLTTEAIRSLRSLGTVADIVQGAPDLIASLGFERVLFSEIRDEVWLPLDVRIERDKAMAADVLAAGKEQPQRLRPTLLETNMVRTRRPIHVVDVQRNPKVNKPIAAASKSSSYLAVPVVIGTDVGALIHVDRYWSGVPFTTEDASRLTLFAEALGLALERAHLVGKLTNLAAELGSVTRETVFGPDSLRHRKPVESCPTRVDLTPREREVGNLLAAGMTNDQIAAALVLSEATVKSHVKHILRKLDAGHRAEAVAKLIRLGLA